MQETLSRWLESSAGDVRFVEHPAVHTINEALIHVPAMPGLMVKKPVRARREGPAAFSRHRTFRQAHRPGGAGALIASQ
ncbi:hypothetical protein KIV45_25205 [Janthinobacterium lividum]|nr:hypothetical protein KIV45_25205 [Janthinobacterium lividum]